MASFSPGSGTIQVTSKEKYLAALIWLYQERENDLSKNLGKANFLTSSNSDDSTKILTANLNCPIKIQIDTNGNAVVSADSPFTEVLFFTGGEAKAQNLLAALIEATIWMRNLELTPSANPTGQNNVSFTISSAQPPAEPNSSFLYSGSFEATYRLPTTFSVNAQGQQVREAVDYLI